MSTEHRAAQVELRRHVSLPEAFRPSSRGLEPYIPNPALYNVAYDGGADLRYHGVLHGEETMVLTAILLNLAVEDVRTRQGDAGAADFRTSIDEPALLYAAANHDCGRISDWGLYRRKEEVGGVVYRGELQIHGPRGAEIIRSRPHDVNQDLSDDQVERMATLVGLHTPTPEETKVRIKDLLLGRLHIPTAAREARRADRARNFEDYNPDELMLRLLQEADKLGKPRGFYVRTSDSTRRTAFALATSGARVVREHIPFRDSERAAARRYRFPQTTAFGLHHVADSLTYITRTDPGLAERFSRVPHSSGIALAAGEKMGILKP